MVGEIGKNVRGQICPDGPTKLAYYIRGSFDGEESEDAEFHHAHQIR